MDAIFDFSAAPHLPYSLRQKQSAQSRPEVVISVLLDVSETSNIVVREDNGEVLIAFDGAA